MAGGHSCPNPACANPSIEDIDDKRICVSCGTVLHESSIVSEITFGETSSGAAVVQGSYIGADQSHARSSGPFRNRKQSSEESREQTLASGRRSISQLASALGIHDRFVETAARYFTLAVTHNFIQGRRTQHVVACCLYIACRLDRSAYMLIDFSDVLQINVFNLGATYLKLIKTLCLNIPQVDPELWVRRFAKHLEFGDKTQAVCIDAIRIVQRMSRDWIMEGRRPSGICGAALLIAARMNSFRRTVTEIVYVVKVANMTVSKRLEEFKATKSSDLTVSEFRNILLEHCHDPPSFTNPAGKKGRKRVRQVNDDGEVIMDEFENQRLAAEKAAAEHAAKRPRLDKDGFAIPNLPGVGAIDPQIESSGGSSSSRRTPPPSQNPRGRSASPAPSASSTPAPEDFYDVRLEKEILERINDPETLAAVEELRRARLIEVSKMPQVTISDDPEDLADVDDDEVNSVIMSDAEVALKTKIWYEYNRDYLLETEKRKLRLEADAVKKGGTAAGRRKKKHKPRDSSFPDMPASPADSAREMMKKRTFSKKINYAALDCLFNEEHTIKTP